jgi:hypothetical protein
MSIGNIPQVKNDLLIIGFYETQPQRMIFDRRPAIVFGYKGPTRQVFGSLCLDNGQSEPYTPFADPHRPEGAEVRS